MSKEKNTKGSKFLWTVLIIVVLAGCLNLVLLKINCGRLSFAAVLLGQDKFYEEIELYTNTMTIIQREYVDEVKIHDLIYGSLKGMLSSLDPHSQFMKPDEYKEIQVETSGEFGGLGIEITLKDNLLTVIAPIEGTPAYNAGVKAGDRIVAIDNGSTKDITLFDAVKKLRGKPGSKVTLTILREKTRKIFDVTVVRDIIKVESIRQAKILEDGIGYIRLATFGEKSADDVEQALDKLESEGMKALIFDLRNNAGGLLDTSVKVADKFLSKGKIIVTTRGRREDQVMEFKACGENTHPNYPMVVLVNNGSASASEIVAGAIKDHKRGVLLGTKTFGKGSVQTIIPLPDSSALKLTTAKYFTPNGQCIHDKGIEPDIKVEYEPVEVKDKKDEKNIENIFEQLGKKKEEEQQDQEQKENEQQNQEQKDLEQKDQKEAVPSELEPEAEKKDAEADDNQIQSAVNVLKGILVYQSLGAGQ